MNLVNFFLSHFDRPKMALALFFLFSALFPGEVELSAPQMGYTVSLSSDCIHENC